MEYLKNPRPLVIIVLAVAILFLLSLYGISADDRADNGTGETEAADLWLGFFSEYDEVSDTLTLLAGYQEFVLHNGGIDKDRLRFSFMSDLIEVGVYAVGGVLYMVSFENHGMPEGQEEFEELITGYEARRAAVLGHIH
jgi:hypothetical protein